ncbi:hypothetical protein PoB_005783900 [Plakobranchus ocellatus]|uniref:Uncharacterized protein n=1 Tax=Plakobranchus ocellatus TaxID=259542 RepID=A0AAV4CKA1_9GAST|nr:hypothetical protein PoB_005783900 [Plakobranchus ocellatus]
MHDFAKQFDLTVILQGTFHGQQMAAFLFWGARVILIRHAVPSFSLQIPYRALDGETPGSCALLSTSSPLHARELRNKRVKANQIKGLEGQPESVALSCCDSEGVQVQVWAVTAPGLRRVDLPGIRNPLN